MLRREIASASLCRTCQYNFLRRAMILSLRGAQGLFCYPGSGRTLHKCNGRAAKTLVSMRFGLQFCPASRQKLPVGKIFSSQIFANSARSGSVGGARGNVPSTIRLIFERRCAVGSQDAASSLLEGFELVQRARPVLV